MITGAAGGLGKAFAAACARRGFDLFLTDVSPTLLGALAKGIEREFGVSVATRACDLADAGARDGLFAWLGESGLRFTGLVNAAGMDREGEFAVQGYRSARAMIELNVEASVENIARIMPLRAEGRPLTAINVASLAAFQPMPYKAVYSATKRFLVQFSLAIREELRPYGVRVSALCPSGMPTTRTCLETMEAQGALGALSTMNPGDVADYALRKALKGRPIIVPGVLNRAIYRIASLAPQGMSARFLGRKWAKALRKRCGSLNPGGEVCGTPRLAEGEALADDRRPA
jgi:short-subunit dehydrogenase